MLSLGFWGWIIIGGLAGWAGQKITHIESFGTFLSIIVGIVGGLIGGFIFSRFGINVSDGGLIFSFITCFIGSIIFIGILKALDKR